MTIDTLTYANKLKAVGVPDIQAETQAEILAEIIAQQKEYFSSKQDLQAVEARLNHRIDEVETRLNYKIDSLESRLNYKIEGVESSLNHKIEALGFKMTIRLGTMLAASIMIMSALNKFL